MELSFTLVQEAELRGFLRFIVPLASAELERVSDAERRRRVSETITGLGALVTDERPWIWLKRALELRERPLLNQLSLATYYITSTYVNVRGFEPLHLKCGSFEVHAWLLREATGCPWIIPSRAEPRAAEFRCTHFRRFCWLAPEEAASVRVVTPLVALREAAQRQGDAPTYPAGRRALMWIGAWRSANSCTSTWCPGAETASG